MDALPDLTGAPVALTAPDGTVYHFHYAAAIPYAGTTYAVLMEDGCCCEDESQILITRVSEENGTLAFTVAQEEDVIEQVYAKYLAQRLRQATKGLQDAE